MYYAWELALMYFIILFTSALVHEYGHKSVLKELGRDVNICWVGRSLQVGTEKDYIGLSKEQLKRVYLEGVIMGLAPITFGVLVISPLMALTAIPYLLWSSSDIKEILRCRS